MALVSLIAIERDSTEYTLQRNIEALNKHVTACLQHFPSMTRSYC